MNTDEKQNTKESVNNPTLTDQEFSRKRHLQPNPKVTKYFHQNYSSQKSVSNKIPERVRRLLIAMRENESNYYKEMTKVDPTLENTAPESAPSQHERPAQNTTNEEKSNNREKKEKNDRVLQLKRKLQYVLDDSNKKIARLESILLKRRQEADAKQDPMYQKIDHLKGNDQGPEESLQQHKERDKGGKEDPEREVRTDNELNEQRRVEEQMCQLETDNEAQRQRLLIAEQTVCQLKSHTKELKRYYEQEAEKLHALIRELEEKITSSDRLKRTIEELVAETEKLKEDKNALTFEISMLESRQRSLEDSLSLCQKNEEYSKMSLKKTLEEIANIEKALENLNKVLRENQ